MTSDRPKSTPSIRDRDLLESAAQTLEAIGSGLIGEEGRVRIVARAEAHRLREVIDRKTPEGTLEALLADLAAEFAQLGLVVEYFASGVADLRRPEGAALSGAIGEALSNVIQHAATPRAVVRAMGSKDGVRVTVRDHGSGFELRPGSASADPSRSVGAHLERVGGTATVWSEPGRGTRVSIWKPG
ncbi:MAG: ATP-binding protein [Acidimicrobiales bacterium]